MSATRTKAVASAITADARQDAIDTLDRARCLADFLGWVASVRELEREHRAQRRHAPPGDLGSLPATMDFTEMVSNGHQWAFFHLGELLEQVGATLDHAATGTS